MAREEPKTMRQCDECGAVIYPEHLQSAVAGYWQGKLLCRFCLSEHKSGGGPAVQETPVHAEADDKPRIVAAPSDMIRFSGGVSHAEAQREDRFRRPLLKGSAAATRCKSFHGKLTDAAIAYLNDQINDWVDAHDDVEIKFAQTTVGPVEGKHTEPHLIITLFF